MISVVTFKWSTPGYRSKFTAEHVNIMRAMVRRQYKKPHRFICITDDPKGIDPDIEVFPMWDDFKDIPNPTWGAKGPSCYRRLKVFHSDFERIAGKRFVCIDLDAVIVGDLEPLWDRPEDFVIYREPCGEWPYNGSMFLMTAGCRRQVWDDFDPLKSPRETNAAGYRGSDQAWISYRLGSGEAVWDRPEVIGYRGRDGQATIDQVSKASIVMFFGPRDPWDVPDLWVRQHYRLDTKTATFRDLIGKHAGKRIVVMGGAPSLKDDIKGLKADVWISANEHGAKVRKVDYVVAMDASHGETGREMSNYLHEVTDAPLISGEPYADYQLTDWPGAPKRGLSGMMAAWCAWAMGGHPVILAGFDAYDSKPSAMAMSERVQKEIKGEVRVVSGPLTQFWPAYDKKEKYPDYAPDFAGLLKIDGTIRVRVRKPTQIAKRDVFPGQELTVLRHEVARLLKHQMVEEL